MDIEFRSCGGGWIIDNTRIATTTIRDIDRGEPQKLDQTTKPDQQTEVSIELEWGEMEYLVRPTTRRNRYAKSGSEALWKGGTLYGTNETIHQPRAEPVSGNNFFSR